MQNRTISALFTATGLICFSIYTAYHLLLSPFLSDYRLNNHRLAMFEHLFKSIPHPAGTRRLCLESRVGLLVGNGNHCDFFLGEVRESDVPREVILGYYEGVTFIHPLWNTEEDVTVVFPDQEGNLKAWLPDEFSSISDFDVSSDPGNKYVVYYMCMTEANFDLRCN